MTVKRYGSAVFDSGLIEMACGDYVTYSDYRKLVAENAKLKELSSYVGMRDDYINYERVIELRKMSPATDDAIAEIKAQGVDELIADRKSEWMVSYCEDAAEFAANLRAGRKG